MRALMERLVAWQPARYLVVGGIGYVVNLVSFWLLLEAGVNPFAALFPAFVANTLSNYWLNRTWTFESTGAHATQLWRYSVLALFLLGFNFLNFYLLYEVASLPEVPAQAIAIIIGLPVGFLGSRYWAFRDPATA